MSLVLKLLIIRVFKKKLQNFHRYCSDHPEINDKINFTLYCTQNKWKPFEFHYKPHECLSFLVFQAFVPRIIIKEDQIEEIKGMLDMMTT